jgi:multimeric flavodoxin WrbA
MNKVLAFVGSPRKSGNTSRLVEEILSGAEDTGAEVTLYHLEDLEIEGCQGCLYCRDNPNCVIKDDMQMVYSELKKADAVVLGTPMYINQISGQTKLLLDRFYPLTDAEHKPRFGEKKLVLAYTQAAPLKIFFWWYRRYFRKSLKDMGLIFHDEIVATKCFDKQVVANNDKVLRKAYKLGQNLDQPSGLWTRIKSNF